MRLYELTGAFAALLATDEPEEFDAALAQLEGDIEAKIDGLARVIRTLEAEGDAYKAEADRLAAAARIRANRADALKAYIKTNLETMEADKVKGAGMLFGARLQNNSSPSVQVPDVQALPLEYQRVIPAQIVPDTAKILEAYKAGAVVPGAVIERGRHVRIF